MGEGLSHIMPEGNRIGNRHEKGTFSFVWQNLRHIDFSAQSVMLAAAAATAITALFRG